MAACKECGTKLDPLEEHNAPALEGNCVGCFTSPKTQARRQATEDLRMSPFTSVQRIHQHLTEGHGIAADHVDRAMRTLTGSDDPHQQSAQHAWHSFHSLAHSGALAGVPEANHDVRSTQLGSDEFDLFNDRR